MFGTSGHRGSSLDGAFTETHIAATTQAIVEYRTAQGTTGDILNVHWDDRRGVFVMFTARSRPSRRRTRMSETPS